MRLISLFLTILFFQFARSQATFAIDETGYLDEVYKLCSEPDILNIQKSENYIEIDYICNGKKFELVLDRKYGSNTLETNIDIKNISEPMWKKINKQYPGWIVDEINEVIFNGIVLLKVELFKDGIEQNLYFTPEGKLFKRDKIKFSGNWESDSIKFAKHFDSFEYNLIAPSSSIDLPEILLEISGVAIADSNTVFCVQDELGIVFEYDLSNSNIKQMYRFTDIGDFEDIEIIDNTIYILRSDGMIFHFKIDTFPNDIHSFRHAFQSIDMEGMFYDSNSQEILFAAKTGNINDNSGRKSIYASPLSNPKALGLRMQIPVDSLNTYFLKHHKDMMKSSFDFSPSAIAVHPINGNIYVLSATDRFLAVFGKNYDLINLFCLPASLFNKPEGIDFFPNGDMMISNEGTRNGELKGNLMIFKYKMSAKK